MLKRIVPLVLALVLCAGLAQAKTKAPATQLPGDLTLAEAQKVLDAALVKAKAQGVPMNIAIVDAGGNLKAFVRQDGAFIGSIDVSTKKAVTARYFNMPTSTLGAASQPGQELFGIEATNGGLVIFGGGELLIRDNVIVGAIGVSGGSVAEDTNVVRPVPLPSSRLFSYAKALRNTPQGIFCAKFRRTGRRGKMRPTMRLSSWHLSSWTGRSTAGRPMWERSDARGRLVMEREGAAQSFVTVLLRLAAGRDLPFCAPPDRPAPAMPRRRWPTDTARPANHKARSACGTARSARAASLCGGRACAGRAGWPDRHSSGCRTAAGKKAAASRPVQTPMPRRAARRRQTSASSRAAMPGRSSSPSTTCRAMPRM